MSAPAVFDEPQRVKLTVEDFDALHRAGAFAKHRHAELIDGEIYDMSPQHRRHSYALTRLLIGLSNALAVRGELLTALLTVTVSMKPHNAPEPDLVITSEPEGEGYVPVETVRLAVEVSDSTLNYDLKKKLRLYARFKVPEYWVVDVSGRRVYQFWSPEGTGYEQRREVALGEQVEATTIPALTVDTSVFL